MNCIQSQSKLSALNFFQQFESEEVVCSTVLVKILKPQGLDYPLCNEPMRLSENRKPTEEKPFGPYFSLIFVTRTNWLPT